VQVPFARLRTDVISRIRPYALAAANFSAIRADIAILSIAVTAGHANKRKPPWRAFGQVRAKGASFFWAHRRARSSGPVTPRRPTCGPAAAETAAQHRGLSDGSRFAGGWPHQLTPRCSELHSQLHACRRFIAGRGYRLSRPQGSRFAALK